MYRDPAPREEEESVKKPWWKFWQCREQDKGPITASVARELAEATKRKLHEDDIEKCRAWFEEKIELGVSKGWTGLTGSYELEVSEEAYEVVSNEYKDRGFHTSVSPKKKGYHISWTDNYDLNDVHEKFKEHDSK